jgi:phenylpyruvate tautomerase PptA (4-oxalocrotonate tautomerase family)
MPLDLYVPKGSLARDKRATLASELTENLLKWTDASDDDAIRANVSVWVHELPSDAVNAGGHPANVARLDIKVPTVALTTRERRQGVIADATAIVQRAATAPFEHVWVIVSHAIDGGWGVDGRAFSEDDF